MTSKGRDSDFNKQTTGDRDEYSEKESVPQLLPLIQTSSGTSQKLHWAPLLGRPFFREDGPLESGTPPSAS